MEKQKNFKEKGITLVALVITIIILVILAGISISTLTGENGIFEKTKLAKQEYDIAKAKEELQLKIMELRLEVEGKGDKLVKEHLPKLNSDEIDVRSVENFPVEIIYGKYKFNVDASFIVTYVGDANETVVTYTTEPKGYTNEDSINILIKVKNIKGIKTIEYPDGDKLQVNGAIERGIDYRVTANGIYTFKITDVENNEVIKDIVIDKIDKLAPLDFTPTISEIKTSSFMIAANAVDAEADVANTKSGIDRYEYYIKANTDTEYTKYESTQSSYTATELDPAVEYNVYVVVYDKANNLKKSNEVKCTTLDNGLDYPILTLNGMMNCIDENGNYYFDKNVEVKASNALKLAAYDNDFTTYITSSHSGSYFFEITPECWNKYISVYCETPDGSDYGCLYMGSSYSNSNDIVAGYLYNLSGLRNQGKLVTKSALIKDGCYWGYLTNRYWFRSRI